MWARAMVQPWCRRVGLVRPVKAPKRPNLSDAACVGPVSQVGTSPFLTGSVVQAAAGIPDKTNSFLFFLDYSALARRESGTIQADLKNGRAA